MRIIIAGETSGKMREAFRKRGHDAYSCDLLPADDGSPHHYRCDMREILCQAWDMLIAHPSCQFLSVSGMHWVSRGRIEADGRPRAAHVEEAIQFAQMIIDSPTVSHIPKRIIENPIGIISTRVRKPDQIIQPYQFGDDASKKTCLWLCGVEPLRIDPAQFVQPRMVLSGGKMLPRWANQTDSGQNVLLPSADRWKKRSETYAGIAAAFAAQWG